MGRVSKARYFAFIVYSDNAPENWVEILKETHCSFAISPEHDPSESPSYFVPKPVFDSETGEVVGYEIDEEGTVAEEMPEPPKKHFHVVLYTGTGPASIEAAKEKIPEGIAANGHVEMVSAPRNYQRYLIHLDDKDKQQFVHEGDDPYKKILVLNNFPLDLTRDYSKHQLEKFRCEIFEIIRDKGFMEYSDLIDYLMNIGDFERLDYAANHTMLFSAYLASKRGKEKAKREKEEREKREKEERMADQWSRLTGEPPRE